MFMKKISKKKLKARADKLFSEKVRSQQGFKRNINKPCNICGELNWYLEQKKLVCRTCRKKYVAKYFSNPKNRKKREIQRKAQIARMKIERPIHVKVRTLISGFRWGVGGADRMEKIINGYLGTLCKYCKIILTLDNCSADHKIPYAVANKGRRDRPNLKKVLYTKEEDEYLRSPTNIHIICFSCNKIKSNMTDEQFVGLLNYLDSDPKLKLMILTRLKRSNMIFGR